MLCNLLCMHDGADAAGGVLIHPVVRGLIQPAIDELMQSVVYMNMHVYMYMCMYTVWW